MQRTVFAYKSDWDAGTYGGTNLDTQVAISPYNHPALVPTHGVTSTTLYTGQQVFAGALATKTGTAWASLADTGGPASPAQGVILTTNGGDFLIFNSLNIVQVSIQFAGQLVAGSGFHVGDTGLVFNAIRNGAVASVYVDGVLQANIDTYNGRPDYILLLDGASHTVKISHSGLYNAQINPIGPVVAGTGTSVSSGLTVANASGSEVASSWRVTALSASTYKVEQALPVPPGGTLSYSLVAGGPFNTGTAYTSIAPGTSITVSGALTIGDSATFETYVTMMAIESISTGAGSGTINGLYTSPVLDSGNAHTQWFLAEWVKNAPYSGETLPIITVSTGNQTDGVSVLDGVPQAAAVQQISRHDDGTTRAAIGLMALPAGQYCQFGVQFPPTVLAVQWIRDLVLYSWIPDPTQEPDVLGRIAWPLGAPPNELTQAYEGMLATFAEDYQDYRRAFKASFGIAGAVDQYLLAHGLDRAFPPISGIDPQAYRTQLLAFTRSRGQGGSTAFICEQVAILVNGVDPNITSTVTGGKTVSSGGGVTVAQTTAFALAITVPHPPYVGLSSLTIQQAQTAITSFVNTVLRPLGHAIAITYL